MTTTTKTTPSTSTVTTSSTSAVATFPNAEVTFGLEHRYGGFTIYKIVDAQYSRFKNIAMNHSQL